jgi:hypothetical protein
LTKYPGILRGSTPCETSQVLPLVFLQDPPSSPLVPGYKLVERPAPQPPKPARPPRVAFLRPHLIVRPLTVDPAPVARPFTRHFRPFAARPLILATGSGIMGLHRRSSRVQRPPCNGGKDVQDYPKGNRDGPIHCSARCGNGNLGLAVASTVLDTFRGERKSMMKDWRGGRHGCRDPTCSPYLVHSPGWFGSAGRGE